MAKLSTASVLAKLKEKHEKAFADIKVDGKIKGYYLDSPQLNYIFGGKWPLQRIVLLHGPESSGKSSVSTYLAVQNQKHNTERPMVVYIDFERSFVAEYAAQMGLDMSEDKFIFLHPDTGEEAFDICKELIEQVPVGLIIWDSVGATPDAGSLEDNWKASFGGTAKVFSAGLKALNPILFKTNTSMILINQERALIGGFSPLPGATSIPGGFAIKFYASSRNRVTRIETIKDKQGNALGIKMKIRNIKSKVGIPFREAILDLYYDRGIDSDGEYLKFILDLLTKKAGAWYTNDEWGMHVQGAAGVQEFLNQHPDIYQKAKDQVNEILCGKNELDDNNASSEEEAEELSKGDVTEVDSKNEPDPNEIEANKESLE